MGTFSTKRLIAGIMAGLAACIAINANAIGISSGQPTGGQWPIAEDLRKVCSTPENPINNITSNGATENIYNIYTNKQVQYGIVPQDALVYEQGKNPRMMERILMVFPFYSAEVHLIVKDTSPIKQLSDLQGKRVADGPEGSGTIITTTVIRTLTGMSWVSNSASQGDGLKAVLDGTVDAQFIVAGAKINALKTAKGVRLVSIKHPKIDSFGYYNQTMLPSKTYDFQDKPVYTYSVDTILATFAFKNQYQQEISSLVTCITRNLGKLQTGEGFHPKWRDVDPLQVDRIKWPVHPAALRAIKAEAARNK